MKSINIMLWFIIFVLMITVLVLARENVSNKRSQDTCINLNGNTETVRCIVNRDVHTVKVSNDQKVITIVLSEAIK